MIMMPTVGKSICESPPSILQLVLGNYYYDYSGRLEECMLSLKKMIQRTSRDGLLEKSKYLRGSEVKNVS